jgi:hypothetical protein
MNSGTMPRCANCFAEDAGEYCPRCGERRLRPDDLSATRFLRDVADQIANFRFTFKSVRSLRALSMPGVLTADYLVGRRSLYLNPLRLYLVCAAIFFLSAPWAGFTLDAMMASDQTGRLSRLASAQMAAGVIGRAQFTERFDLRIQTVYTIVLGIGVVALALLLQMVCRRDDRPFGAHLVFALHFVAFQYLVTIVIGVVRQLGSPGELAAAIGIGVIAAYLVLALKRVYGGTIPAIAMRAAALLGLTLAVNNAASIAAIRLTLLLV